MAMIVTVTVTIGDVVAKGFITTSDIIAIGTSITIIIIGLLAANQARKNQKVSRFSSSALYDIQREYSELKPPKTKKVPDLLPYLPNLTAQEEALDKAIQNWNYPKISQILKHCPFFCLICGDINKDAADFVMERFKKYFSFKLNPNNIYGSLAEKYLDSDDHIKEIRLGTVHKAANLHDEMWKRLKKWGFAAYSGTDWKIILAKKLAGENCPIFIYATIDTTNWQRNNIDKFITEFIAFWYDDNKDWSKIVTQEELCFEHPLVVYLFFHCDKVATHKLFRKPATSLALPPKSSYEFY